MLLDNFPFRRSPPSSVLSRPGFHTPASPWAIQPRPVRRRGITASLSRTADVPRTGPVLRLPFPMSRTDYSPLPLPCLRRTVWAFTGRSACACRLIRPLLTSAFRFSLDCSMLSPHLVVLTGRQISRGKFDRFPHTTGGSTCAALMDMTLPRFHVHQNLGNFLMNGGTDE